MIIDKTKFKEQGRPRTQSLFLEITYTKESVYSLKDQDHEWDGNIYPSLKRLYLEMEDPVEYDFANKYLLGWSHWLRIYENKQLKKHIDEWREELDYKLKAKYAIQMAKLAAEGNYQATKWFLDKGWNTRSAGRPTKAEVEGEKAKLARISDEYGADVHRLFAGQGK